MTIEIFRQIRPAIVLLTLFTLITGVLYPLAVTGLASVLFPRAANGNLIVKDGKVVGSRLIGQPFDDDQHFWSRPSATGPYPYNASVSSGSNLGPTNAVLIDAVQQRVAEMRAKHPEQKGVVPIDLVTASGSGLDPHISPAAAYYQIERVATSRGLSMDQVAKLVEQHLEPRTLGVLGEPRVNVLLLNLALDDIARKRDKTSAIRQAQ
jgi:potassium-transporting ATPase KdpC subunit